MNPHLSDSRGLPCRLPPGEGPVLGPRHGSWEALALRHLPARWVLAAGQGEPSTRSWVEFQIRHGLGKRSIVLHCHQRRWKLWVVFGSAQGLALLRDSLHWDVLCPWLVVGVAPCEGAALDLDGAGGYGAFCAAPRWRLK